MSRLLQSLDTFLDKADTFATTENEKVASENESASATQQNYNASVDKNANQLSDINEVHSSVSDASGATASNPSLESREKSEIEGLKQLWNEERSNVRKATDLLWQQKEKHRQILTQKESEMESKIAALRQSHNDETATLRQDLQRAINSERANAKSVAQQKERLKSEVESCNGQITRLQSRLDESELEKNSLLKEAMGESRQHSEQIQRVKTDFSAQRQTWESERKLLLASTQQMSSRNRESALEAENIQNTTAFALTQQKLQQKELEVSRLKSQLKWLEQDRSVLKNELEGNQNAIQLLTNQLDTLNQTLSDANAKHNQEKKQLNNTIESLRQQRLQQLSIAQKDDNDSSANVVDAKKNKDDQQSSRLTALILDKQTIIDDLTLRKKELETSLMQSNVRITKLDQSLQNTQLQLQMRQSNPDFTVLNIRQRNQKAAMTRPKIITFSPTVNLCLDCFDHLGTRLYLLLKTSQWIRLIVTVYLFLIHIWIIIIMFQHHHILSEFDNDTHNIP